MQRDRVDGIEQPGEVSLHVGRDEVGM